jgi:hypothetical protein
VTLLKKLSTYEKILLMARHSTGFWLLQLQTMTLTVLTLTNPPVESQATLLSDRASAGGVRPMLQQIVDQLDVVRQLAAKLDWCEKVVPHSRGEPNTHVIFPIPFVLNRTCEMPACEIDSLCVRQRTSYVKTMHVHKRVNARNQIN